MTSPLKEETHTWVNPENPDDIYKINIRYHLGSGLIARKYWLNKNGFACAPNDKPSMQEYSKEGLLMSEIWTNEKGEWHRINGPAQIVYQPDGVTVKSERWWIDGDFFLGQEREKAYNEEKIIESVRSEKSYIQDAINFLDDTLLTTKNNSKKL